MTKSPRKLVLHKETVRALTNIELRRAVGGADPEATNILGQTGDKQCPAQGIVVPAK
jgi:hypothetical protein